MKGLVEGSIDVVAESLDRLLAMHWMFVETQAAQLPRHSSELEDEVCFHKETKRNVLSSKVLGFC